MPDFKIGDRVRVVEDRWRLLGQRSRVGRVGRVRAVQAQQPPIHSLDIDVQFTKYPLWFSRGELCLWSRPASQRVASPKPGPGRSRHHQRPAPVGE